MIYEIHEMTWDMIEARMTEGNNTVILPVGATEQHGTGCPIGADSWVLDEIGRPVADRLNCFWAPLLPYGASTHHMDFKGTMTLSGTTLALVVKELILSLAHHGFRHIVILSGHLGNVPSAQVAAREAKTECDAYVALASAWQSIHRHPDYARMIEEIGGNMHPRDFCGHGGNVEAAVCLVHNPESVRLDHFTLEDASLVKQNEASGVAVFLDMSEYSPSGTFGQYIGRQRLTADFGKRLIAAGVEQLEKDLRESLTTFGKNWKG
jgi:creatinine amidohydrolase